MYRELALIGVSSLRSSMRKRESLSSISVSNSFSSSSQSPFTDILTFLPQYTDLSVIDKARAGIPVTVQRRFDVYDDVAESAKV